MCAIVAELSGEEVVLLIVCRSMHLVGMCMHTDPGQILSIETTFRIAVTIAPSFPTSSLMRLHRKSLRGATSAAVPWD